MKVACWVVPINEGKVDALRELTAALENHRRAEYEASEHRIGVAREVWMLWEMPTQSYCILFMQGEDLEAAIRAFNASEDTFDIWGREGLSAVSDKWPDPIWGGFGTPGVAQLLSVYDSESPELDAANAS